MIIVTTFIPPAEIQKNLADEFPDVDFIYQEQPDEQNGMLEQAEILVTYGEDMTPEIVRKAAALKWVMVVSAGLEMMPLAELKEQNIQITNARGIHRIPMAEYVIGMMLQLEKKLHLLKKRQQERCWDRGLEMGEIYGKTLLVAGTGAIGREIARLANAFGMKTIGVNRSGKESPWIDHQYKMDHLQKVLPEADYVVSVLPSTPETKNVYTSREFSLMKNSAVFMNIGRGDAVDEQGIAAALQNGEISHAVLDVFREEPLNPEHLFWKLENLTITPHISSRTAGYLPRAFDIFIKNLNFYLANDVENMDNLIDQDKGY